MSKNTSKSNNFGVTPKEIKIITDWVITCNKCGSTQVNTHHNKDGSVTLWCLGCNASKTYERRITE